MLISATMKNLILFLVIIGVNGVPKLEGPVQLHETDGTIFCLFELSLNNAYCLDYCKRAKLSYDGCISKCNNVELCIIECGKPVLSIYSIYLFDKIINQSKEIAILKDNISILMKENDNQSKEITILKDNILILIKGNNNQSKEITNI